MSDIEEDFSKMSLEDEDTVRVEKEAASYRAVLGVSYSATLVRGWGPFIPMRCVPAPAVASQPKKPTPLGGAKRAGPRPRRNCRVPRRQGSQRVVVPYCFRRSVVGQVSEEGTLITEIFIKATHRIESGVPGLLFVFSDNLSASQPHILLGFDRECCESEVGKNLTGPTTLSLAGWATVGIAMHEILHALGMEHEHQRSDRAGHVRFNKAGLRFEDVGSENFTLLSDAVLIGDYDDDSIMHYPDSQRHGALHRGPEAWAKHGQRTRLSHLDKVGLNMLFPPVPHPGYQPRWSSKHRLYYCGRRVMNGVPDCDGLCGPDNGPNCEACRQYGGNLQPRRYVRGGKEGFRYQGETGWFYCGKPMLPRRKDCDGYCGPNNGPPCRHCFAHLS